LTYIFEMPF